MSLDSEIKDILSTNGTTAMNGSSPVHAALSGQEDATEDEELVPEGSDNSSSNDTGKGLESIRFPASKAAAHAERPQVDYGDHEAARIDEFSHQSRHHEGELIALAAEIEALDTMIDVDQVRIRDLQVALESRKASLDSKMAARKRLAHLHGATTEYLNNLAKPMAN